MIESLHFDSRGVLSSAVCRGSPAVLRRDCIIVRIFQDTQIFADRGFTAFDFAAKKERKIKMNIKELSRLLLKVFCICMLAFFGCVILIRFTAYAADGGGMVIDHVRACDMTGHEVRFDSEGQALNAGPVRFTFDMDALLPGESYVYEDGSTVNPVEDGEFILYPGSSGREVLFLKKSAGGNLERLSDNPCRVSFTEGIYEKPEARLIGKPGGYALYLNPAERSRVFCEIRGGGENIHEEIESSTRFDIDEDGIYSISVYSMDGMGHKTYADLPEELTVDNTSPVLTRAELKENVSREGFTIPLHAYDELSGVEGIYVREGDGKAYKADEISISPPYRGSITYWAVDNKGNETEKLSLGEIIADNMPPLISSEPVKMDEESLTLYVSAKDDVSGVKEVAVETGKKVLYKGSGMRERIRIDLGGLPYGSSKYVVRSEDLAGNVAESTFTVEKKDEKAPSLELSGASDRGIYGKDVKVRIKVSDDHDRKCSIKETVSRYSLKGEYQGEYESRDDTLSFDRSGIYMIKAEASDTSGNRTEKSLAFAIDRDAPVIKGILGLEGKELKSFMMDLTSGIAEDQSMVNVKVLLNGMDYNGEVIKKAGRYRLQVLANDEFGNSSTAEAGFMIR